MVKLLFYGNKKVEFKYFQSVQENILEVIFCDLIVVHG